jgi:RNA polymerase sigma factor for flagellar operon FliA
VNKELLVDMDNEQEITDPRMKTRLQDEEDQKLWEQYKTNHDQRIKDALIMKYASFVKYVAGRIAVNLPSNVEFDDLVSYGILGLIDAIDKYDPERNVKFKTYAKTRIRGAIFDELRVLDWTPRSIRQKARKLEKAYAKLEGKLGRDAKDEEIAEYLNIDISELHKLFDETKKSLLLSLDEIFYDDEEGSSRFDFIEDQKSDNPQLKIEEAEAKQILADAIGKLSDRERMVITLYYYEELTSKEIGKILGVSDSRVSQLHTNAILRLRGRLSRIKEALVTG